MFHVRWLCFMAFDIVSYQFAWFRFIANDIVSLQMTLYWFGRMYARPFFHAQKKKQLNIYKQKKYMFSKLLNKDTLFCRERGWGLGWVVRGGMAKNHHRYINFTTIHWLCACMSKPLPANAVEPFLRQSLNFLVQLGAVFLCTIRNFRRFFSWKIFSVCMTDIWKMNTWENSYRIT